MAKEISKKCPYCAETIKAEAIVCRFCGRTLSTSSVESASSSQQPIPPAIQDNFDHEKKGNAALVWPAVFLIVIACPLLVLLQQIPLGIIAAIIGLGLIIYAMVTGRLKLLG